MSETDVRYLSRTLEVQQRTWWEGSGDLFHPFHKVIEIRTKEGMFLAQHRLDPNHGKKIQVCSFDKERTWDLGTSIHFLDHLLIRDDDDPEVRMREFHKALERQEPGLRKYEVFYLGENKTEVSNWQSLMNQLDRHFGT